MHRLLAFWAYPFWTYPFGIGSLDLVYKFCFIGSGAATLPKILNLNSPLVADP